MKRHLTTACLQGAIAIAACVATISSNAATYNLAADWSTTQNPNGVWSYGYLNSEQSLHTSNDFIDFRDLPGPFVAFDHYYADGDPIPFPPGAQASGVGWSTGDEPGSMFGHLTKSTPELKLAIGGGVIPADWPAPEDGNPKYPHGVVGGHSGTEFLTGPYAVRFTAPEAGVYDIDVKAWQAARYAEPSRSQTRAQNVMIFKDTVSGEHSFLVSAPMVTRNGWFNRTGTPEYNLDYANPVNDPSGWASPEEEMSFAIRSSENPNVYRIRDLQLQAGESVVLSMVGYDDGVPGFMAFDMDVKSGADRQVNTHWSLVDDFDYSKPVASGLGPNGVWSYGIMQDGSFTPYDKRLSGIPSEDPNTPQRERSGWTQNVPVWLLSTAPESTTGRLTPGIMKDYDGNNFTRPLSGGLPTANNGDFNAGDVVMALPSSLVDEARTGVVSWTAPRTMNVNVNGALWRATKPIAGFDSRVQFSLTKNGVEIASGVVDDLNFDSAAGGTNSHTPEEFSLSDVAVSAGDVLALLISPVNPESTDTSADFNRNNAVNADDFALWQSGFGVDASGDADFDNDTDGADFLKWQRQAGGAVNMFVGVRFDVNEAATPVAGAVPEPGSLALVGIGCLALGRWARRQRANWEESSLG